MAESLWYDLKTEEDAHGDDGYGWFKDDDGPESDGDTCGHQVECFDGTGVSTSTPPSSQDAMSALSIASAQREHQASVDDARSHGETLLQLNLVTRCFVGEESDLAWTWGVGGYRVVRGRECSRHVEYQIVASLNGMSWSTWRRFSKIAAFAKDARDSGAWSNAAQEAWESVHGTVIQPRFDSAFLGHVCNLLHNFLRQFLFACCELDSLLAFVGSTRRHGGGHHL